MAHRRNIGSKPKSHSCSVLQRMAVNVSSSLFVLVNMTDVSVTVEKSGHLADFKGFDFHWC